MSDSKLLQNQSSSSETNNNQIEQGIYHDVVHQSSKTMNTKTTNGTDVSIVDDINNNHQHQTDDGVGSSTSSFTPDELRRARSSIITLAIGGLLVGYDIGIVGVLLAFYKSAMSVPCTAAVSESICEWLAGTNDACLWVSHRESCITNGVGQLCLSAGYTNASFCNGLTQAWNHRTNAMQNISCFWSSAYSNVTDPNRYQYYGHCIDDLPAQNSPLYSSAEAGAITVMLIVGGFIGSWFSRKYVATPLKTVKALQWVGVISVVSCLFHVGSWLVPQFGGRLALLLIARFIAGIVLGSVSVFCVMFNALNSPAALVSPIGVYFQVFLTLGIFLAALFGYSVRYTSHKGSDDQSASAFLSQNDPVNNETMQKFQFVYGMNILCSFLMMSLPFLVTVKGTHLDYFEGDGASSRNSFAGETSNNTNAGGKSSENNNNNDLINNNDEEKKPLTAQQQQEQDNESQRNKNEDEDETDNNEMDPSSPGSLDTMKAWKDLFARPHLVIAGTLLALIQQFSSINAIMFYAPKIASSQGISDVFLSNMVIMAWNFVTAIVAIPVAKIGKEKFGLECQHLYTPGAFFGALCCFIVGIGSYPGVASASVHNGLSIFGLALFLLFFEVLMGPNFYTMTQSLFPESVRKTACVWTNSIHFCFTALVSFGFPLVIEGFGGGGSHQTPEQEQKGIASAFIMFGCINLVSVVILKLLLPKLLD